MQDQATLPQRTASQTETTLQTQARHVWACLDLTSLTDAHATADGEADIDALCQKAQGLGANGANLGMGHAAAVCVWPRLAAHARTQLPASIAVAAVANFPHGGTDIKQAVADTDAIAQAGAQEVDVVLPYRALIAGDVASALHVLQAVRKAAGSLTLKVILETGELQTPALIQLASQIAIDAGADFIKTSTGKTAGNATLQAAQVMVQTIAQSGRAAHLGFKPSGGLRTVQEAYAYIALTRQTLGEAAVQPSRFRIGASSIYSDIVQILASGHAVANAPASGY